MPGKLPKTFYCRDTVRVARDLLGKTIVSEIGGYKTSGMISETEAYSGKSDMGCHSCRFGFTPRTKTLFGEPGRAYVYFVYGMYSCFNTVAHVKGTSGAVLLRALKPLTGIETMARRRGLKIESNKDIISLANGPGKLCIALGIDKKYNEEDLSGRKIYILLGRNIRNSQVDRKPRIGIDYAGKAKKYLWRFIIKDN